MALENYQRWQLLLRDVTSPQSYIDFGFYFVIAAALQRRVWMGQDNPNAGGNLFPNIYPILVGDPGVGKGRVILPVNDILKHWRQDISTGKILEPTEELEQDYSNYLFQCGPENTTFEQMVDRMSKCLRRVTWDGCINPIKERENSERPEMLPKIYSHSSMYFALEELSSLMQKDTHKITDFLIQTYDCSDYRRETKTQGIAQLKKPCLSFIAGTTPAFMEDTFKDRLLTDGMSSRCWFVYEFANRKNLWGIKPLDNDQLRARYELLMWLHKLARVYGRVELSADANEFLRHWWENLHPVCRPNNNMKLASYYSRKNIHVMKLAMIMHFSETIDSFTISLETARRALESLDAIELRMHYALNFGNRNPFHAISRRILTFMFQVRRPVTKGELLDEFSVDLRAAELDEVIRFMQDTDKIVWESGKYIARALKNSAFIYEPKLGDTKPTPGADLPAIPLDKPVPPSEEQRDLNEEP